MVIGNGLLAKAFGTFVNRNDVTVFASGVSNSGEKSAQPYERELELLHKHLDEKSKLIYFSTVSVYDKSMASSRYINHKLQVEKLIADKSDNWLVFRLPIVVGHSNNPHTLTNFLFQKISKGLPFQVHANACRYLLDIDEVTELLSPLINSTSNAIYNVHLDNRVTAGQLVNVFEKVLNRKAEAEFVDKGSCYDVPLLDFGKYLNSTYSVKPDDYNYQLIKKYYGG